MDTEWALKVTETTRHKEPYIHPRAKVHCYSTDKPKRMQYKRYGNRLCDGGIQEMDYYESFSIDWVANNKDKVCKKCLNEYSKGVTKSG